MRRHVSRPREEPPVGDRKTRSPQQGCDQQGTALDGDGNGTAGGDNVSSLHRLYGDTNGDARVDNGDFFLLRQTFGRGPADPLYLAYLDVNGDGLVDALDFFQFRSRYGTNV